MSTTDTDFICGVRAGSYLLSVESDARGIEMRDYPFATSWQKVRVWNPMPERPELFAIDFIHAKKRLAVNNVGAFELRDQTMFYEYEQFHLAQWPLTKERVLKPATPWRAQVMLAVAEAEL